MYLLSSSASSFLLRILTGTCARRVCMSPSNPCGQATSDAAAAGTGAKDARRTSRGLKKSFRRTRYRHAPEGGRCSTRATRTVSPSAATVVSAS